MELWQRHLTERQNKSAVMRCIKSRDGFSNAELLIVLGIVSIAAALSVPQLLDLKESLNYRQAARDIASTLRVVRSLAISENWEHRVEFDVAGRKYRVTRGNLANSSSSWPTIVKDWVSVPSGVTMRRNSDCESTSDVNIQFNPNGTANSQYLCVADSGGAAKFRVGVSSSVTGRVKVDYPD